jgi:hypothetical protein
MANPLVSSISDLAQAIGADIKTLTAGQGTLSSLSTTAKGNLVAALNELKAAIDAIVLTSLISDAATGTASDTSVTWSAYKIKTQVDGAIAALINAAPATLDTLKELADALTGQDSTITNLLTAVGNRVRFDADQTLTADQIAQVWENIGLGDPAETDFAAAYDEAKE